jgi:hypothetical protein
MPPKKTHRCAYVERGRRCGRAGTGNPPLCEAHRVVLEAEATRPARPGEKLVDLLGRAFQGKKISDRQVMSGIEDLMGMFQQHPSFDALRAQAEVQIRERARRIQQQRGQQQRQKPPPTPPPRPAGPDPRVVLGFAAGQKLTVEEVKKRHRELARKHHPDRGGSVAVMQQINAAVDQLLASM